jgi:hypothetical protein
MSDCTAYEEALKTANRTLYEKHQLILWKINHIEQREVAVHRRPFVQVPRGGFSAHVIGETIWTDLRARWERAPDGRTLEEAEDLTKQADVFIAWLDGEQGRAAEEYNACVNEFTRMYDDWRR